MGFNMLAVWWVRRTAVSKLAPIVAASFLCSIAEQKDIAESDLNKG